MRKSWILNINEQRYMQTAWGEARFNLYEGTVLLDGEEFTLVIYGWGGSDGLDN